MKIDEVIELPDGSVRFQGELSPDQTTAMVRWFITHMLKEGAVRIEEQNPEKEF